MSRKLVSKGMVALTFFLAVTCPATAAPTAPVVDHNAFRELIGQLDDVTSSTGPLGSLLLESLTPADIAEKLHSELGITLAGHLTDFDPALLYYLYSYFKVFPPDPSTPLTLEQSTVRGPELVRKEPLPENQGVRLIFTQDAATQTITEQVRQTLAQLQATPTQAPPTTEVRISFQNTLFEKLTTLLLSYDQLVQIFKQVYHVEVTAAPTGDVGEFTPEELSAILRSLVDLRPSILRILKLTKITRMSHGFKFIDKVHPERSTIALYVRESQEIQLTDEAFQRACQTQSEEETNGESDKSTPSELPADDVCRIDESFVHEVGHALWFGLPPPIQNAFSTISWQLKTGKWFPKSDHSQFFSPQSMENPPEDFAEHFRAYLNHGNRMAVAAPDKSDAFKTLLFPTTTYVRTVHERMQVYVDSDQPDLKPPAFSDTLRNSITITATGSPTQSIEVTIRNLSDDISGIESIDLYLHRSDGRRMIFLTLKMSDYDAEQKVFHHIYPINKQGQLHTPSTGSLQPIYTGDYGLSQVNLRDRAQNFLSIRTTAADFPLLAIQGLTRCYRKTQCLDKEAKQALEAGIQIEQLETQEPFETFRVRIPLPHPPELQSVTLGWFSKTGQQVPQSSIAFFRSSPGADVIEFDFQFSNRLQPDELQLTYLRFQFLETSEYFSEGSHIALDYRSHPNLQLTLTPSNSDSSEFTLDINAVPTPSVDRTSDPNANGGNRTIKVLIPLEDLELSGIDQLSVSVQGTTPSGKSVHGSRNVHQWNIQDSTLTQDGKQYLVIPIALPPNNEEGTYNIQTLEVTKILPTTQPPPNSSINRQSSHTKTLRFNLQEREIQTKFRIYILDN